jgi:probable F420-dependent oxidoreductase
MKFRVRMPGNEHIPFTNGHPVEGDFWAFNLRAPQFQEIAAVIDDLGYDTITVSEHFAMPYFEVPRLGPYWMHALSAMAFIAGATRRVRVDCSVLVAPYHHPLELAKSLSTIDVLSGGRLNVSLGVGHARQEFTVLGVPFSERGARTDEILEAMKVVWAEKEPVYQGRYYQIDGLAFEPKPVQRPRPPIFVGGNSDAALRRAARHDGWHPNPTNFGLAELPERLDYLRSRPEFVGKEDSFDVSWIGGVDDVEPPAMGAASEAALDSYRNRLLERYAELGAIGITTIGVATPPSRSADEYLDFLRWFASEVTPLAKP